MPNSLMTAEQCRAARAMLCIGVRELAEMADTSPSTVCRFESGAPVSDLIVEPMHTALAAAGIIFLASGRRRAPGVRLKQGDNFPTHPRTRMSPAPTLAERVQVTSETKTAQKAETCGARKRNGKPCGSRALYPNGRCKFHGGLSTGPRTPEGKAKALRNLKQFCQAG